MNKNLLFFILLFSLLLAGCHKNRHDFSRFDGVDAQGEWGIPLVNADYSIQKIIDQMKDGDLIVQTGNGNLFLSYESDIYRIADAGTLLKLPDTETQGSFTVPNLSMLADSIEFEINEEVDLENEYVVLKQGSFKEGRLTLTLSHDIVGGDLRFFITIPEFKYANNQVFQYEIAAGSGDHFSHSIDVAGLTFRPEEGHKATVMIQIRASQDQQSTQETFHLNLGCSIEGITFQSFYGQVAEYGEPFSTSLDFDIFSNRYGGDLTVYNPELYLMVKNSFFVGGAFQIDTASLQGSGGRETPLFSSLPQTLTLPVSPTGFQKETVGGIPSISLRTDDKSLKLAGKAVLNPGGFNAGDVFINDQSLIEGKLGLTLPFSISSEQLYYNDTLLFSIDTLDIPGLVEDVLEEVAFRTLITNGLPLNMKAQVYLYDSQRKQTTDSLFDVALDLPGVISEGSQPVERLFTPVLTGERVKNAVQSDRIIINLRLDTDGQQVNLNARDGMKVKMGMRLKYDSSGISLRNNSGE